MQEEIDNLTDRRASKQASKQTDTERHNRDRITIIMSTSQCKYIIAVAKPIVEISQLQTFVSTMHLSYVLANALHIKSRIDIFLSRPICLDAANVMSDFTCQSGFCNEGCCRGGRLQRGKFTRLLYRMHTFA